MAEEDSPNYKKKECPFQLLLKLSGKEVLISEVGEKSSILPIAELDCYVYTHKNVSYVVLADEGVNEEHSNTIKVDISKVEEIQVVDLYKDGEEIIHIHILTRFKSGNELHIIAA